MIALSNPGLRFEARGLRAHPEAPDDDRATWSSVYSDTADAVTGHPIDPAGVALRQSVSLSKREWSPALDKGDAQAAAEQFKLVSQKLDKTASTSTMHKKTAARKKSRLARRVNALQAQKA